MAEKKENILIFHAFPNFPGDWVDVFYELTSVIHLISRTRWQASLQCYEGDWQSHLSGLRQVLGKEEIYDFGPVRDAEWSKCYFDKTARFHRNLQSAKQTRSWYISNIKWCHFTGKFPCYSKGNRYWLLIIWEWFADILETGLHAKSCQLIKNKCTYKAGATWLTNSMYLLEHSWLSPHIHIWPTCTNPQLHFG